MKRPNLMPPLLRLFHLLRGVVDICSLTFCFEKHLLVIVLAFLYHQIVVVYPVVELLRLTINVVRNQD